MRRLKIVEQIIIVLVFAVLVPFVTMGLIINNVSQQSIRAELANNATLMARFIGNAIENYVNYSQSQLNQMASGFNYIPNTMAKVQYFDEIEAKTRLFKNLDVVEKEKLTKLNFLIENSYLTLYAPIDKLGKYYLTAQIQINIIDKLFSNEPQRDIYIFDSKTKNLLATNSTVANSKAILAELNIKNDAKESLFGKKKNTPKAYYKMEILIGLLLLIQLKKLLKKQLQKLDLEFCFLCVYQCCLYL